MQCPEHLHSGGHQTQVTQRSLGAPVGAPWNGLLTSKIERSGTGGKVRFVARGGRKSAGAVTAGLTALACGSESARELSGQLTQSTGALGDEAAHAQPSWSSGKTMPQKDCFLDLG